MREIKEQIWYEVFSSDEKIGTTTLESFDTLKEARQYKTNFIRLHPEEKGKVWIDKWGGKEDENPMFIASY